MLSLEYSVETLAEQLVGQGTWQQSPGQSQQGGRCRHCSRCDRSYVEECCSGKLCYNTAYDAKSARSSSV